MGYSNFLFLKEELSLIAVMLILLVYDLFGSQKSLKYFHPVACVLFLAHTLLNLFPAGTAEAFGGVHTYIPPKASAVPAGKRFSSVWARNNTQATG